MLYDSNIPKRYRDTKFAPINEQQKELAKLLTKSNNDIVLLGSYGLGKTYMTCSYLSALKEKGISVKYSTEYEYAEKLNARYSNDSDSAKDASIYINQCKSAKVLVLDEVGKRKLTEKQLIDIDELISARYDNEERTIYISNLTADGFKKLLPDRSSDRIRGNGGTIYEMKGESLR